MSSIGLGKVGERLTDLRSPVRVVKQVSYHTGQAQLLINLLFGHLDDGTDVPERRGIFELVAAREQRVGYDNTGLTLNRKLGKISGTAPSDNDVGRAAVEVQIIHKAFDGHAQGGAGR